MWKPIETAPKDGTNILVAGDLHHDPMYGVAYWYKGGWQMWWSSEDKKHDWPEVWVPVPKPPESEKEQ